MFVIWDEQHEPVRLPLEALARRPPKGMEIVVPGLLSHPGDYLHDVLVPGIRDADRVVLFDSGSERRSLDFRVGLALGFQKPIAVVIYAEGGVPPASGKRWGVLSHLLKRNMAITSSDLEQIRGGLLNDKFWQGVSLSAPVGRGGTVVLAPDSGGTDALIEELGALHKDWEVLGHKEHPSPFIEHAMAAERVIWILPPLAKSLRLSHFTCAMAAGAYYASALQRGTARPDLVVLRSSTAEPIPDVQRFERPFSDLSEFGRAVRATQSSGSEEQCVLERVEIRDFKCIEHLVLDFSRPSSLAGHWACVAGLNGAGKTAILQAIAMVLLGPKRVAELGRERIRGMRRRVGEKQLDSELRAVVREGARSTELYLPLGEDGVDEKKLYRHPQQTFMARLWEEGIRPPLLGYGASRNLSDYQDRRHTALSVEVQQVMTLYDPLSQVVAAEILVEKSSAPFLVLLREVVAAVFPPTDESGGIEVVQEGGALRLKWAGVPPVRAFELPDGYRSTLAWLADLCRAALAAASPPRAMRDLAAIDEIDLHLHASLQRTIVSRLREAFPNVQFVVTTHSPFVLTSFDRSELHVLDRSMNGGVRPMDRDIFGFTPDQVYRWLMGTPAHSPVLEQKLQEGTDPNLASYLLQSETRSAEEAHEKLAEKRKILEQLQQRKHKR